MAETKSTIREVTRLVPGMPASDGAGVRLTRLLGQPRLPELDPFLLLDEIHSAAGNDYIAGFPDHPHRGFETVTIMLEGRMRHADNKGHGGLLRAGSVQWMTAGRGIVHSEMPEQEDGLLWGFQLWVNLPAKDKMVPPRYQEIEPEAVPEAVLEGGVKVRIIAGTLAGVTGPINGIATEPRLFDVTLPPGASFVTDLPAGHSAFAYPLEGEVLIGEPGCAVAHGTLAVLGAGERVTLKSSGGAGRVLLAAGRPLGEPVARYGPFVMNSRQQIEQAVADYQAGLF